MAITLASVSKEQSIKAPRILILGVEKIGKTSFACGTRFENGQRVETGLNSPIVIPVQGEEGADAFSVPKFPVCTTYAEVVECLSALYDEDHEHGTIVLDSASAFAPLVHADVCEEFSVNNIRKVPGFRTGEAAVAQRWRDLLDGLVALRDDKEMASIIICHVRVKNFKNPEGGSWDTYEPDLDMGEGELLKRWADVVLFCNTKVVVHAEGQDTKFSKAHKTGVDLSKGQRFLYTHKTPAHPGGGREPYGQLPYELPLDWAAFEAAVSQLDPY